MLKNCTEKREYKFILDNIRHEDKRELEALYGGGWYEKTLENFEKENVLVLYGKDFQENTVPVAIGGFRTVDENDPEIGAVWLLTTKYIYKNSIALSKALKTQIEEKDKQYKIMFNYIYKSNYSAKKWLKKLGFKFDNPYPEGLILPKGYEFFYKVNE